MQSKHVTPTRILITGIVTILIFGLLFWQHFHGGVPSHHFLQRKDLPEISNWWGGLLLPLLTWVFLGRIAARLNNQAPSIHQTKIQIRKVIGLFLLGLGLGISIAVAFEHDYHFFLHNVIYIILALSLVFTIYFPEFILGAIFGMTYTFGAILPTIFILIMAAFGFVIYKVSRLIMFRVTKVFSN